MRGAISSVICWLMLASVGMLPLAAPGASNDWSVVYERDFVSGDVWPDWSVVGGKWVRTPEGIRKLDNETDAVLMLGIPLVSGAVKVEYEARAGDQPGDLSLLLGTLSGKPAEGAYLAFGSGDNTLNRIRIRQDSMATGREPLIQPGKWHKVTAVRERGKLALWIDGVKACESDDSAEGYGGPFLAFYCWNEGTFRNIRVSRREDPELKQYLLPPAFLREARYAENPGAALQEMRDVKGAVELGRVRLAAGLSGGMSRRPQLSRVIFRHAEREGDKKLDALMPSAIKCRSGQFLAVFSGYRNGFNGPEGKIGMIRSPDGWNWSEAETVVDTPLDDRQPGLLELSSGALLLTWLATDEFVADRRIASKFPEWQVEDWKKALAKLAKADVEAARGSWVVKSADGGKTWGKPVRTPVHSPHGPIQLKDGRLLYFGRGLQDGKDVMAAAESSDEGATWKIIWSKELKLPEQKCLANAHAVELADGRILALMGYDRPEGSYRYNAMGELYWATEDHPAGFLWQTESADGGKSWGAPRITTMFGNWPHLAVLPGNRVLCTYHRHDAPWGARAAFSADGGKTWDTEREIILSADSPSDRPGHPTTVRLDDKTLLTVYAQSFFSGWSKSRAWLYATRWAIPDAPAPLARQDGVDVVLGEPVTVIESPTEERRWGFYNFPGFARTTNGAIVASCQVGDDSTADGGIHLPPVQFTSKDNGNSWSELKDTSIIDSYWTLRDGTRVRFQDAAKRRASELGIKPVIPKSEGLWSSESYRYGDLPAEMRGVWAFIKEPGKAEEKVFAPVEFPDLLVTVFYRTRTSAGFDNLAGDLYPPGIQVYGSLTLELPDGVLLYAANSPGPTLALDKQGKVHHRIGQYLMASEDRGRSWKLRSVVAYGTDEANSLDEPALAMTPKGTLICLMRDEPCVGQGASRALRIAWSKDKGVTWEEARFFNLIGVWPQLKTLDNGVTVCSYGRPVVELRFSRDGNGREWSEPYPVIRGNPIGMADVTCGYSGLAVTGPDRCLVVYSDFYHRDADWVLHKAIKVREIKVVPK